MQIQPIRFCKDSFYKRVGIPTYMFREMISNHTRNVIDFIRYGQWPMFRRVLVETSSYCNRKCKCCPVAYHPRKTKEYIDGKIFETIVSELAKIDFSGSVGLHFFNEPLADPTIVEKVRMVSTKVPKAIVRINSNGDYLKIDLLRDLISARLNDLFISQYGRKVDKHIQNILEEANEDEMKVLRLRVDHNFLGNRAGTLDNNIVSETLHADCFLPSDQLVINYKGEVIICCNDYYGKVVLGKVGQASLIDIWNCKEFKEIRYLLEIKQRSQIETCKNCSFLGSIYGYKDLTSDEIAKFNKSNTSNWKYLCS